MESALLVPVTSSADFSYWRKWILTFRFLNHLFFVSCFFMDYYVRISEKIFIFAN